MSDAERLKRILYCCEVVSFEQRIIFCNLYCNLSCGYVTGKIQKTGNEKDNQEEKIIQQGEFDYERSDKDIFG